jgi:alpha-beta hydrolase superfamily lysophospholipase
MLTTTTRALKYTALVLAVVVVTVFGVRAWDAWRSRPLSPWHMHVPHELRAAELDTLDWAAYAKAEAAVFADVEKEVTATLPAEDQLPSNRYSASSPLYPARFAQDWNRSYVLEPAGPPSGVVVLLHGLTDSPYSLRHIARHYQARGWTAVAPRMPGHGTVPAGLTAVDWEDWAAATRLAVREARRRVPAPAPLHLVGFSNGGTLAMNHTLHALGDPTLGRPDRVVLLSPMIGVTSLARFAGVLGWPAVFPAFANAAWLDVLPEFNPFKYNSFPVHAARESSLFSRSLQQAILREARSGRIAAMPPVLTFQSVLDYTVSAPAVVTAFYAHLPANGSELVLFDYNHNADLGPLMRPGSDALASRLLPAAPRRFHTAVITNAGTQSLEVTERRTGAGTTAETRHELGLTYPRDVFSLSHVALPFPPSDSLYGSAPTSDESFGAHLGAMAARGERAALVVNGEALVRMSSNPFFPYVLRRIDEGIARPK